jgi:hypothetical protein
MSDEALLPSPPNAPADEVPMDLAAMNWAINDMRKTITNLLKSASAQADHLSLLQSQQPPPETYERRRDLLVKIHHALSDSANPNKVESVSDWIGICADCQHLALSTERKKEAQAPNKPMRSAIQLVCRKQLQFRPDLVIFECNLRSPMPRTASEAAVTKT